jgi:hypothetical protein
MLPFLKARKVGSTAQTVSSADGHQERLGEEGETDVGLMSAAEDLIRAVHAKDAQAVADAMKAAFEIMEEMPHEEGPHIEEE